MFDWTQDPTSLSVEVAREFHDAGTIPPNTYVWLARNVPLYQGQASGATHSIREDDVPKIYLVTFRIDQLVVQVLMGLNGEEIRPNRPRHGDAVRQIWPQGFEAITWPPARTLDEYEYGAFGHAFIRDYFARK